MDLNDILNAISEAVKKALNRRNNNDDEDEAAVPVS